MLNRLQRFVRRVLSALDPVRTVAGVLGLGVVLGFFRDKIPEPFNWIVLGLLTVIIAIQSLTAAGLRWLWRVVKWLPHNIWLLFFGQVDLHQRVKDLHRLYEAGLFARIASLETCSTDCYHILFTHKGNVKHPANPGSKEQYRIPGFPYDEAETIMRLWYQVAQTLRFPLYRIRPRCSCSFDTNQLKQEVLCGSYAIIGSPKGNPVCERLMIRIEEMAGSGTLNRQHRYVMKVGVKNGEDQMHRRCYLHGDGVQDQHLWPDSTEGIKKDEMVDYALFMKLPNILSDDPKDRRETVLVLAGCKVGGQVALTDWISDPKNLAEIHEKYAGKNFYYVLKVHYAFVNGGIPNILRCERTSIAGEINVVA